MTTTPTTSSSSTRTGSPRAPRVSAEERRAQAAALHESITVQIEQLRDTDQWQRFLTFAAAFHAYSLGNVLLIRAQCPDATIVAGFRAWRGRGRQVRKGEKAICIFGFAQRPLTSTDVDIAKTGASVSTEESGQKVVRYHPMVSVFDISQTDLIDGTDDPRLIAQPLTGSDDFGVITALTAALATSGWTVTRQALPAGKNGYAQPHTRTVALSTTLAPEHAARTLIHETAHVFLGHVEDMTDYTKHRGLQETEAESVAYVVAGLVGFDSSAYSIGYIAGWSSCNTDVIKSTATRVLAAAHCIAALITPDTAAEVDEAGAGSGS